MSVGVFGRRKTSEFFLEAFPGLPLSVDGFGLGLAVRRRSQGVGELFDEFQLVCGTHAIDGTSEIVPLLIVHDQSLS